MRGLACLTAATVRCMVGLKLGEDGLPAGLTGVLDDHNAADTGGCCRRGCRWVLLVRACASTTLMEPLSAPPPAVHLVH